jgi:hypothetical protein
MADRTPPWVQPWSEPTVQATPGAAGRPFNRGVAQVNPRHTPRTDQFPTTEEHPHDEWQRQDDEPRVPVRFHARQLRRGGEWTSIGLLWAFICWGIWAVSVRGADLLVPALAFALVLLVAGGVFALSRLVGRVILERMLRRLRRSAWGAHLITGLFLFAAGVAYLGQTQWVVDGWAWLRGVGG